MAGGAVTRLGEAVAPRRLGNAFRWLWASSIAGNLADGLLLAAAPLLVASLTNDPFAVAMAVFLQRLPWLLFGVLAGALVDRLDRRLISIAVDVARGLVVAGLAVAVALDVLSLPVIYATLFLLGSAETIADNAASAIVPDVVPSAALGIGNSRLIGSMMVTNQLAGPPIGALLFGLGMAVPFATYAVIMGASAVLISRIGPLPIERGPRRALRHEIGEGLTWLWHHAPIRTLALTITAFNLTFGAAMAVYVLYAQQRLGVGELGFGVLLSATAVGGVAGAALYGRLERRFRLGTLMRAGLVIETMTHLALALVRAPLLAGLVMFVFGMHAAVWGTTSMTVRQRAVPSGLLGRVNSVYLLGSVGAIALGTLLGGVLAEHWGITAPFWFAFAGSAVVTVLMWRTFLLIAHSVSDAAGEGAHTGAPPPWTPGRGAPAEPNREVRL